MYKIWLQICKYLFFIFCPGPQSVIYENCDSCVFSTLGCFPGSLSTSSSCPLFIFWFLPLSISFYLFNQSVFLLLSPFLYFSWWMSAELSKVTCEIKRKAKQSSQQASWELKAIFYQLPNRSLFYPLHLVINYYNKETLLNKIVSYWFGNISGDTAKLMEIKVKGPLHIFNSI